jgi:ACS family hexuronate transporter-like MFS transporter
MFLLAYMLSFLVVGWLTDRLGVRVSAILFIGWWSLANMCTGFVGSMRGLATTRFLLGAGESGLYTVAPKIVGQMFPASERSLAVGIYSAGATVGATIAPPLIATLTAAFGWRAVFFAGGVMGLIWILPWFGVSGRVQAQPQAVATSKVKTTWRDVLFCREAILLLGVRLITDVERYKPPDSSHRRRND